MQKRVLLTIVMPILVAAIFVPIMVMGTTKLQGLNQEKEQAKPSFVSHFDQVLGDCSKMTGAGLVNCKQILPELQQQCSYYDNPPICSDARIQQILNS